MPEPAKGHEPEQQVNEHDHHDDHEDDRNHRLDGFWNGQPVDHKPDQPEDQANDKKLNEQVDKAGEHDSTSRQA